MNAAPARHKTGVGAAPGLSLVIEYHDGLAATPRFWPVALPDGTEALLLVPIGFSRAPVQNLQLPGPVEAARFLAMELIPGALDGIAGTVGRMETPARATGPKCLPGGAIHTRSTPGKLSGPPEME